MSAIKNNHKMLKPRLYEGIKEATKPAREAKPEEAKIDMGKIDTPAEIALLPNVDSFVDGLCQKFVGAGRVASVTTTIGENTVTYLPAKDNEATLAGETKTNESSLLEVEGGLHEMSSIGDMGLLPDGASGELGIIGDGVKDKFLCFDAPGFSGGTFRDTSFKNEYSAVDVGALKDQPSPVLRKMAEKLEQIGVIGQIEGSYNVDGTLVEQKEMVLSPPALKGKGVLLSKGKIGEQSIQRLVRMNEEGDLVIDGKIGDVKFSQVIDFE